MGAYVSFKEATLLQLFVFPSVDGPTILLFKNIYLNVNQYEVVLLHNKTTSCFSHLHISCLTDHGLFYVWYK